MATGNPISGRFELRPHPGPQEDACASSADILIFGGARGGGKTFMLLFEALRHVAVRGFGAVIFRRTSPEITNEGGLWDSSKKLYPHCRAKENKTELAWYFPPHGTRVRFAHLEDGQDRVKWQGAQIPLLGFDELTHFREEAFYFLLGANRSLCGVRPYVRATCNPIPDDDPIGGWVARFIAWWIDQDTGFPIEARAGKLRWFVRPDDEIMWADDPALLRARYPGLMPKSLTFIPSKLEDNPSLDKGDPSYRATLQLLPSYERARMLGGNWKVRASAGKVFNRAWFEIVAAVPAEGIRRVRYWDLAASVDGDYTVGARLARAGDLYYVEDVVRGRWTPSQRDAVIRQTAALDPGGTEIWIEEEPGSAGKSVSAQMVRMLVGYSVHTERATGDKVVRAGPLASQAEAGNVKLLHGPWNAVFLSEFHAFPDGAHDDQVDGASGAFNKLAIRRSVGIFV